METATNLDRIFYALQQLGMMLGFGAQIILLCTYLIGTRDGAINETEDQLAKGVYRVLLASLFIVALSGVGIIIQAIAHNETSVFSQPAFVFKWVLIVLAVLFAVLLHGRNIWNSWYENFAAANWGALFLLHIFAPVATYILLLELYGVWLVGFSIGWMLLVYSLRPHTVQYYNAPISETEIPKPPTTQLPEKSVDMIQEVSRVGVVQPTLQKVELTLTPTVITEPQPIPTPPPAIMPQEPVNIQAARVTQPTEVFAPPIIEAMPEYVFKQGGFPFPMSHLQPVNVAPGPTLTAQAVSKTAIADANILETQNAPARLGGELPALRVMPRSPEDIPKSQIIEGVPIPSDSKKPF